MHREFDLYGEAAYETATQQRRVVWHIIGPPHRYA